MSMKTIEERKALTLMLSGDDLESYRQIRERMEDFISHATAGDALNISVTMSLHTQSEAPVDPSIRELFEAFAQHFGKDSKGSRRGTIRNMCAQLEISRATVYNWLGGSPISITSAQRLIRLAPTPELKALAESTLSQARAHRKQKR